MYQANTQFNINIVIDNLELLAGRIRIQKGVETPTELLQLLEDSNYLILGYDDEEFRVEMGEKLFTVFLNEEEILNGYSIN